MMNKKKSIFRLTAVLSFFCWQTDAQQRNKAAAYRKYFDFTGKK